MGGILGCSPRMARKLIDRLVGCGKLFETPSGLTNMRAEVEITKRKKEARKSVENGSKGGRKRVENATRTKEINDLIQASLKHRAGVIFQKEEDSYLLGTSPAPATLQEGLPASQEARKEDPPNSPAAPPILVSDALASMFRLPRAPDDGFAHDLEIPAILRRSA
jgi:hypothetical protein